MTADAADDPRLIGMFDRQSVELFRAAHGRPWAEVHLDPDAVWGTTGIPLAPFNGVSGTTFTDASADARIAEILGWFGERRIDMTWWVGPTTTPADLGRRLEAHGMVVDEIAPGLACRLDDWQPSPLPPGITVAPVEDRAAFHVATEIMFEGFEIPTEVMPLFEERFADFCLGPAAIQRTWLAILDGRPVATSLGFVVDDVVGIYNVATRLDARRRGAGGAVTAAPMAEAARAGARWAILESSPIGRSMYEGLGFRQVSEVTIYAGRFSDSGAAAG